MTVEDSRRGRIAVTGIGLATPLGLTLGEHLAALRSDVSGIGPLQCMKAPADCCRSEASTPHFAVGEALRKRKNAKFMTTPVRCAMWAAVRAARQSGLNESGAEPESIGVYTGSGHTGLEPELFLDSLSVAWEGDRERDYKYLGGRPARMIDRYFSLRTLSNVALALLSTELQARGPGGNYVHGEIAAALALENAYEDLRENRCDFAVVGGYDSLLTVTNLLDSRRAGLLSAQAPDRACRPFDAAGDGFVLGEGAGFFVLERLEHAEARGAEILGEILSIETAMGAGFHEGPEYEGVAGRETMAAMEDRSDTSFDFVVARGLGVIEQDRRELLTLTDMPHPGLPVTALKSRTGYLGAATMAVELGLSLLFTGAGFVPPILRLDQALENDGVDLICGQARTLPSSHATGLLLGRSLAGQEAAIAMRASTNGAATG